MNIRTNETGYQEPFTHIEREEVLAFETKYGSQWWQTKRRKPGEVPGGDVNVDDRKTEGATLYSVRGGGRSASLPTQKADLGSRKVF